MKITHWGISYFRSIGEKPVMLDLTKKINVLVGANNAGKSNVLRGLVLRAGTADAEIDHHKRNLQRPPIWSFCANADDTDSDAVKTLSNLNMAWTQGMAEESFLQSPVSALSRAELTPIWKEADPDPMEILFGRGRDLEEAQVPDAKAKCSHWLWHDLKKQLPEVSFLPQFRKLSAGEESTLDGGGAITLLSQWQNARIGEDQNFRRFRKIQQLVARLIGIEALELTVDHERTTVIVDTGDLRLPLDSYGTGLHQLIILAIAALSHERQLICIEEPEIHLHPLLQRRFVQFLREETNNRYVITTHSPALISPADDTAVTHLWLDSKGITQSRAIETTADGLRALHDLGAQASDLLQANSVIWVEGPSDRIYLNRWIELLRPELNLREGIDYTIMFYGGRLLARLSMERELAEEAPKKETDELIQLLRINQHSAILIDSDRKSAGDGINETKQRIQAECAKSGAFCWITPGREIENCLPATAIESVYSERSQTQVSIAHKPYKRLEKALNDALRDTWPQPSYYDHKKAQFAHEISKHMTAESQSTDVRELVEALVKVIRHPRT